MKRIAYVLSILALAGCMSDPVQSQGDIAYEPISDNGRIGVRASSSAAGIAIDVTAFCDADRREYRIDYTSTFRPEKDRWVVMVDGKKLWQSDLSYSDDSLFLGSINTLEIVGPMTVFSGQPRAHVANAQMLRMPELCRQMQKEDLARLSELDEESAKKDEALVSAVISRTGVRPMLGGGNQKDFNNLVNMFRSLGVEDFVGKFVWAEDGDYFVSQILRGEVILTSLTNPALFPPISIVTDKQGLEGQRWSSVSRGPLQFVGPKQYQTALGVERQVLVFKAI